jgi:succinoglycan biosynthesis protein ExoU
LSLSEFAIGNLPAPKRRRRELGFLKPVIRRGFLDAHELRYDERLRLGEDVLLYAGCLAAGARFRVVEACGYCAVQHPASLSARHRTEDLEHLLGALTELEEAIRGAGGSVGALPRYTRSTRHRLAHRRMLDSKRLRGWSGALSACGAAPESFLFILGAVARDKLALAHKRLST